ncbi:MAG: hypothetical protein NTW80_13645 [Deltaproteobacteria bacterium]|nr:hypothetical protein [Deltaproteobacteria bacterium]
MKWCDLSCEYASFPKVQGVDGAGSCRTFAALYCAKLARLVHKHGPCACEKDADPDDHRTFPANHEPSE